MKLAQNTPETCNCFYDDPTDLIQLILFTTVNDIPDFLPLRIPDSRNMSLFKKWSCDTSSTYLQSFERLAFLYYIKYISGKGRINKHESNDSMERINKFKQLVPFTATGLFAERKNTSITNL